MNYKLMDEYIGNELFKARVVKRTTQQQVVDKINAIAKQKISRGIYSCYENGKYSMPQEIFVVACEILKLNHRKVFSDAIKYMNEHINFDED